MSEPLVHDRQDLQEEHDHGLPDDEPHFAASPFYHEFLLERDEILRFKWIESEKAGEDIGFEKALLQWVTLHRSRWVEHRRLHATPG